MSLVGGKGSLALVPVNDDNAPKPAVPGTVGRPKRSNPEQSFGYVQAVSHRARLLFNRHFRLGRISPRQRCIGILTPGLADPGLHPDYIFRRSATE